MMKLEPYTEAALTVDLPEYRLCRGDIVKLVDHHVALGWHRRVLHRSLQRGR